VLSSRQQNPKMWVRARINIIMRKCRDDKEKKTGVEGRDLSFIHSYHSLSFRQLLGVHKKVQKMKLSKKVVFKVNKFCSLRSGDLQQAMRRYPYRLILAHYLFFDISKNKILFFLIQR